MPPMGHYGNSETEIGRVVVQLCGPDFKYMSGETITLEGGMGQRPWGLRLVPCLGALARVVLVLPALSRLFKHPASVSFLHAAFLGAPRGPLALS